MTIDAFLDKVMQIRPSNFMGLGGAGAGIVGSTDSGATAVLGLQRATIEFARQYKARDDRDALLLAKKEVVAQTMVAHTLDALSESEADEILDIVQTLVSEGNK